MSKPKSSTPKHKVRQACLFCRRSHMSCDDDRPCARCVKRNIAHLCNDDAAADKKVIQEPPVHAAMPVLPQISQPALSFTMPSTAPSTGVDLFQDSYNNMFGPDYAQRDSFAEMLGSAFDTTLSSRSLAPHLSNETYGPNISDFLRSLDDPDFLNSAVAQYGIGAPLSAMSSLPPASLSFANPDAPVAGPSNSLLMPETDTAPLSRNSTMDEKSFKYGASTSDRLAFAAADQKDGSRDVRLARVIHAKFEAGQLLPFDYATGWQNVIRWMHSHASEESKVRTLKVLAEFRPRFRAKTASLTDLDLILIEESFERLQLDYDRVFSTLGPPACLWRRTGEIYKGNKEFAELVGVPIEALREGKTAIYELMAEESVPRYWEQYGSIAFDNTRKAVLTKCVLINREIADAARRNKEDRTSPEALVKCTFSFTVRRDTANIPYAIVGNFLVSQPSYIDSRAD